MFYEAILKAVKVSEVVSFITFTVYKYMQSLFLCVYVVCHGILGTWNEV